MTVHAIEIMLTRAVGAVELNAAQHESGLPLAASGDLKRLVVLVSAKSEPAAVRKVWKRLADALPIDVLCSLFPGPDGMYRMSIPMSVDALRRLRHQAVTEGKTPEGCLRDAVAQALARDRSTRRARLECQLNTLFREFTPEEVTGAAAQRIRGSDRTETFTVQSG
ncbi:hypothetical protein [Streptomyces sp. SID12501]|uniref:Uncharacterized protein n=1 Tax=Streptomyces sp. SID12501 TaxID=2706042 RepID=A0A6B3BPZ5_9ACTN|nr:hypothetical protein [Streptomyces sp. SID12501]NEC86411.1 hypothetical protein [Streptomyces sp. SID12501]